MSSVLRQPLLLLPGIFCSLFLSAQGPVPPPVKKSGVVVSAQKSGAVTDTITIPWSGSLSKGTYHPLYQTQPRKLTTAALGEVYTPELLKTASPSYSGLLTGRVAGLYTSQTTGEPSNDDVALLLRGQTPFVLVDGTPQSFISFNPEQIESITVLKDALSTAMLGMRSSNGAILITTRKGAPAGKSQLVEFSAQQGIQSPTRMPKFLDAYDYATLYNEALANQGQPALYSSADLNAYKNHTDPIGHPDVDWAKKILKNQTAYSRYDLSFSGTGKGARYFANLDYLLQDGLFRTSDTNSYNTNAGYKRYIFRSNVELDLSNAVTTSLNLFGRIQNTNQPGATTRTVFSNLLSTPNNAYPALNADGSLGGSQNFQNNLYGQTLFSGYQPYYERDFKVDFMMKAKLDVITRGLWIKGLAAINAYQQELTNRSKTFAVYQQSVDTAGHYSYAQYGANGVQNNTNSITSQNRKNYTELSMGYSRTFGAHGIDALVLASNDYELLNSNLPFNFSGVSGKVSYNYKQKYIVEVASGYNGAELYPRSHRYGLFPAAGLGWNINEEGFLKNRWSWLNALKLRASYGKTGNANAGYYVYNQYFNTNGTGYGFGSTVPSSTTTLQQGALATPNITWEKADKFSTGLEGTLLNDRLNFSLDYYTDKYYDLVEQTRDASSVFGTAYPLVNMGANRYSGIEFQATWQAAKGALHYFISPNFTVMKTRVLQMGEPKYQYPWLQMTGRPVGQMMGYVAQGLFQSQAEISSHAYQGSGIQPGDIKYKDLNGDGVIDANDQTAIGTTKPLIYYGLNTGLSYKGFDLAVLFQGVTNRSIALTGNGYWGFQGNGEGQAYAQQLNRWTPGNAAGASYPRLWLGNNTNNQLPSSYWIHSGNYMRIKNIELGYTLPASFNRKTGLDQARIFLNATNLVTFTSLKNTDPEDYTGLYPIMKVLTAGINIKF